MAIIWNHWTETIDWDAAEYIIRSGPDQRGPFKGREATIKGALLLQGTGDAGVKIYEANHPGYELAEMLPDGMLILFDLHDDEGSRMSHRLPW